LLFGRGGEKGYEVKVISGIVNDLSAANMGGVFFM